MEHENLPVSEPQQTITEFLTVLRASGLVAPESLEPTLAPWADATGPVPDQLIQELLEKELLTQWQLDQIRKGKHKGFVLGKYKLLRLLGAGGMGSVYLAKHEILGHRVAIKILPRSHVKTSNDEKTSYLSRFIREAQSAARLSHPTIARVVELETTGTINYMVMEYVEGIDLNAKVKAEGPLDVADAVDFVRQAALGLHYAHEEGFVHRDIKPANLMIDKHGMIKILDLGLAKVRDDGEQASLTQEFNEKVLGTADYLPPEQATNSHDADRRSDIYALGCTLYFLLVGHAPFAKGTVQQRIKAQVHDAPPNPMEARPEVPAAIAEIYFRMMEKNPDARQQTAQEVADSLKAWLSQHELTAHRSRTSPTRRAPVRRPAGSSTTIPRVSPPGTVYRSGPGSSSGGPSGSSVGGFRAPATAPRRSPSASRSDVDLSSLSFTPPPSSGSQTTASLPSITIGVGKGPTKSAGGTPTAGAAKPVVAAKSPGAGKALPGWLARLPKITLPSFGRRKRAAGAPAKTGILQRDYGGQPLWFWLLVAGAVLAVLGLGVAVLLKMG